MPVMDFPDSPTIGQRYTNDAGIAYQWNGTSWIVNYYDSNTQLLLSVGDLIGQVRTLLQDTDNTSGSYRYSTDSIIMALNQGSADLFRIRPDLYLETGFVVKSYSIGHLDENIVVEPQYVSPLVFYVVGLVQARDDEQTQDARAAAFLQTFQKAVLTVA